MSENVSNLRKVLGVKAFRRALALLPDTKKEQVSLARELKRKNATIKDTAEAVAELVAEIKQRRRLPGWARRRGLEHPIRLKSGRRGNPVLLSEGSLRERNNRRYVGAVRSAVRNCLRTYARQYPTSVIVRSGFNESTISLTKEEGWIEYSRRFGNRKGIVSAEYTVRVMRGWISLPAWVQSCDGMLTLAAIRQEEDEQPGETIYRARWAVQEQDGPGVRSGFIVAQDIDGRRYTAHGKSIGAARGSITRQLPSYVAARTEADRARAARIEKIKGHIAADLERGKLNGYDVTVTVRDSVAAGNCKTGTESWVNRWFPGRDSALVSEVLGVHDQHERVLLACVRAIRRQRPEYFRDETAVA